MRKLQSVKKIKPNEARNIEHAKWGRLAGSKAVELIECQQRILLHRLIDEHKSDTNIIVTTPDGGMNLSNRIYEGFTYHITDLVLSAIERRDWRFFRDCSEIVEVMPAKGFIPPASAAHHMVILLMDLERDGTNFVGRGPVSSWTRTELLEFLAEEASGSIEIDDRTLTRIIKQTGLVLKKAKSGPKIIRRSKRKNL